VRDDPSSATLLFAGDFGLHRWRAVKGVKIGPIAATDHWGGVPTGEPPAPVWLDPEQLRDCVRSLKSVCDVVVVQLHWGP
jgi:hypothetical protein